MSIIHTVERTLGSIEKMQWTFFTNLENTGKIGKGRGCQNTYVTKLPVIMCKYCKMKLVLFYCTCQFERHRYLLILFAVANKQNHVRDWIYIIKGLISLGVERNATIKTWTAQKQFWTWFNSGFSFYCLLHSILSINKIKKI